MIYWGIHHFRNKHILMQYETKQGGTTASPTNWCCPTVGIETLAPCPQLLTNTCCLSNWPKLAWYFIHIFATELSHFLDAYHYFNIGEQLTNICVTNWPKTIAYFPIEFSHLLDDYPFVYLPQILHLSNTPCLLTPDLVFLWHWHLCPQLVKRLKNAKGVFAYQMTTLTDAKRLSTNFHPVIFPYLNESFIL